MKQNEDNHLLVEAISAAIGLVPPWYIDSHMFSVKTNSLDLFVKHEPLREMACPKCGAHSPVVGFSTAKHKLRDFYKLHFICNISHPVVSCRLHGDVKIQCNMDIPVDRPIAKHDIFILSGLVFRLAHQKKMQFEPQIYGSLLRFRQLISFARRTFVLDRLPFETVKSPNEMLLKPTVSEFGWLLANHHIENFDRINSFFPDYKFNPIAVAIAELVFVKFSDLGVKDCFEKDGSITLLLNDSMIDVRNQRVRTRDAVDSLLTMFAEFTHRKKELDAQIKHWRRRVNRQKQHLIEYSDQVLYTFPGKVRVLDVLFGLVNLPQAPGDARNPSFSQDVKKIISAELEMQKRKYGIIGFKWKFWFNIVSGPMMRCFLYRDLSNKLGNDVLLEEITRVCTERLQEKGINVLGEQSVDCPYNQGRLFFESYLWWSGDLDYHDEKRSLLNTRLCDMVNIDDLLVPDHDVYGRIYGGTRSR